MILLAIDTAGVDCAVGLYDSDLDRMLAARSETIGRGHAEKLMGMIDAVLDEASIALPSIERLAVTIGPGSFTGIRVGLSAARGLALALSVDIVGISTLGVLAAAERRRGGAVAVLAAMDAKRDEVYVQGFAPDAAALGEARVVPVDAFRDMAAEFARHGTGRVTGSACRLLENDAAGEGEAVADHFPMEDIARLGAVAQASGKPKPLYLRGPDVKPQAGFAVARA
ncbi:tRNA (adenosine(37)-N6)-threonylcarbamoyltransferase complex dimerization subunit type 1 TsaB [Agrobacterium vitis]|uniref:tRNA (adenosine(37)-N6)-threonylcarbamoyltransferase complex dimerization subunit type 1 TsaB n=1 Tax=Rhizobium/Agrobacterium group TaxID=227290 RepID=UPI0008DC0561|nr:MULTISPECIES: tRNA (adenosine(37)-N6)-threonylcarbamoyltransferase complex dimerization subunit type 1 TsaB [Rhizobium/Agrobacterium group]MCF1435557.1 tRNA (adenosine(37)-N6)-threonylcarbamoyltransferase complex dimerization subunit type 1 TsaB [Allorhizobium ampelinum]MUO88671.1 tRNA (adenosine(37)-N6)-threonylcarbamoyltransferase complex dimerization subunit type 1 TsaB [Agrobacterium vitis]MUZ52166.1 tRNA (adenosine(37)-N6)-threonylcarbamoyltransferase complex dimerization subunit type 1 